MKATNSTVIKLTLIIFLLVSTINAKLITFIHQLNGTMDANFGTVATKLRYADGDHYKYFTSVDINLIKELKGLSVIFRFIQKPVSKKQEKEMHINRKVDVCKVLKGHSLTDLFVVFALQIVRKYGHIPAGCPVKPGHYYVHDMTFNGVDFPLMTYLLKDYDITMQVEFIVKDTQKITSVPLNLTFVGGYRLV